MDSMVVHTGELHHHIDEKVGHNRSDVETGDSVFHQSSGGIQRPHKANRWRRQNQDEPGPPCWQNDIGRDSEKVGKRHQEQSKVERQDKKQ